MPSLRDLLKMVNDPMLDQQRPRTVMPQAAPIDAMRPRMVMAPQAPVQQVPVAQPSSMRNMLAQQPMVQQQPITTADMPPPPPMQQVTDAQGTRDRRTQMRDYVADDSAYLRDLEAQPRNWKDKTVDVIRGLNAHFNPGSGPGMPTKRERNIETARGTVGRDLAVDKQRTATEAREAAIAAGQERIRQGDERLAQGDTRLNQDTDKLKESERRRIAGQYNDLEDFDPSDPKNAELVQDMHRAGVAVVPKNRSKQMKMVQNAKTGEWEAIAADRTTGIATSSGVTTATGERLATETEGNLNRAARTSEGRLNRAAAMDRAIVNAQAVSGRLGDPKEFETLATQAEQDEQDELSEAADIEGKEAKTRGDFEAIAAAKGRALKAKERGIKLKEAAIKARSGQQGVSKKSGRTIEGATAAFQKTHNRAPTADEVKRMKAALGP